MRRSREWIGLREHQHEADAMFDALGFSGERAECDDVAALIAMSEFLRSEDTYEPQTSIDQWLVNTYRAAQGHAERDGKEVSSLMLGHVIGRKMFAPTAVIPKQQSRELIDRAFQNVYLAQEVFSHGKVNDLYGALLGSACEYAPSADRKHQAYLRDMVGYTAARRHQMERLDRQQMRLERQSQKIWPHLVRGLATIAMIDGYRVVPPRDQTDENGAWDPGHDMYDDGETDGRG